MCSLLQEEYLLHTCFAAVGHDSLNSSRPISSPAENPTQIKEMFDTVSYDKVCLCLCMFQNVSLTENLFKTFFFHFLDVNTPLSLQDLSRPFLSFLPGRLCPAHAATLSDRWSVSERDCAIPPQVQLQKWTQSGSVGQSGQRKNPNYANCVKRHRFLLCKLWEMVKVTRSLTEIYFTLFGFFPHMWSKLF